MNTLRKSDLIVWRGHRGPAWRYVTASAYADSTGPIRVADRHVVDLARYFRLAQLGAPYVATAARAFPEVAAALQVQKDQCLVDSLRIMILGNLDTSEVLARTGLSSTTLHRWKKIYFDVHMTKDPLGWQLNHVVFRELDAGNVQLAGYLHQARCGGPLIARRLLDGPPAVPAGTSEYQKLVDQQAQIDSFGLFLGYPQSRSELQELQRRALDHLVQEKKNALAQQRQAARQAREDRTRERADHRARLVQACAEAAADRRAAKDKAKADKLADQERLRIWREEQFAAWEQQELAEKQARIAASQLLRPAKTCEPAQPTAASSVTGTGIPPASQPGPRGFRAPQNRIKVSCHLINRPESPPASPPVSRPVDSGGQPRHSSAHPAVSLSP